MHNIKKMIDRIIKHKVHEGFDDMEPGGPSVWHYVFGNYDPADDDTLLEEARTQERFRVLLTRSMEDSGPGRSWSGVCGHALADYICERVDERLARSEQERMRKVRVADDYVHAARDALEMATADGLDFYKGDIMKACWMVGRLADRTAARAAVACNPEALPGTPAQRSEYRAADAASNTSDPTYDPANGEERWDAAADALGIETSHVLNECGPGWHKHLLVLAEGEA